MKKGRGLAILALLVAIGVMGYTGMQLYKANQVYQEGNSAYDGLRVSVREGAHVQGTTVSLSAKEHSQCFAIGSSSKYKHHKNHAYECSVWNAAGSSHISRQEPFPNYKP